MHSRRGSGSREAHRAWYPGESGGPIPGGAYCRSRGTGARPRYGTARLRGLRQSGLADRKYDAPERENLPGSSDKLPGSHRQKV